MSAKTSEVKCAFCKKMASVRHNIDHEEIVNGLVYKVVKTEKDIKRVADFFFDIFFEDEPATKAKGGYKGERPQGMVKQFYDFINDGVSVMCVEPETDFLVGIRVAGTITRDEAFQLKKESLEELLSHFPRTHAILTYVIDMILWIPDIFKENKYIEKMYDMYGLGTHPDYRGKGIATELVRQAFQVARKANCQAAVVVATHDHSRKIFAKLGMTQITQKWWKDVDVNNEVYFANVEYDYMSGHLIQL